MRSKSEGTKRARSLRKSQTESEGLLWSLLRSKQLCGLKFRRQHPIGPYFADFACPSHHVVVELDGEFHDHIQEDDLRRQRILESQRWKVVRFANDDVVKDAEAVARSIAKQLGLPYYVPQANLATVRDDERECFKQQHTTRKLKCRTTKPSPGRYRVRPLPIGANLGSFRYRPQLTPDASACGSIFRQIQALVVAVRGLPARNGQWHTLA